MKKIIIKFSTFILLLCIFAACSKEEKVSPVNDDNNINSQPINKNFNETDIKVFIANADAYDENTDKGGNERFNFGDAIWYLEASINYSFGDANGEQGNIHRDTVIVTIPIATDSSMSYGNVMSTFKHLRNEARKSIRKFPDGRMLIYDITKVEASMINQNATIIAVSYIFDKEGNIAPNTSAAQIPVYNDDYWYFAYEMGKCSDFQGTYYGQDAASVISKRCNRINKIYLPQSEGRLFFTNITPRPIDPGTSNPSVFYYSESGVGHNPPCLTPYQLQQYTGGLLQNGALLKPEGKDIALYFLQGGHTVFHTLWYTAYFHYGQIYYGVRNYTTDPTSSI